MHRVRNTICNTLETRHTLLEANELERIMNCSEVSPASPRLVRELFPRHCHITQQASGLHAGTSRLAVSEKSNREGSSYGKVP